MYHIYSSSIFVLIETFSLCFLFISCTSQTFESQSETDFLPYVHSPGGYSGFQVGMIEWGRRSEPQKIARASNRTKKNRMANFRAIKISRKQRQLQNKFAFTLFAELHGRAYAGTITIFRLF